MNVSIIIPTYKPKDYLWECLDSVYNQDFPKGEYEVIVVLNGCREPWLSSINDYCNRRHYQNLIVLQTDQGGVSNARNIGLDIASGDYVAFIDDDDLISPHFLFELYRLADDDIIPLCYPYAFENSLDCQLHYLITDVYERLDKNVRLDWQKARRYFNGPCMKLIPRTVINGRRFNVKFSNGEDGLFNYLISDRIKFVKLASPQAIYYRRYRTDSLVTSKRSRFERIKNSYYLLVEEIKIYLSAPKKYSLRVLLRNMMGLCWVAIN